MNQHNRFEIYKRYSSKWNELDRIVLFILFYYFFPDQSNDHQQFYLQSFEIHVIWALWYMRTRVCMRVYYVRRALCYTRHIRIYRSFYGICIEQCAHI